MAALPKSHDTSPRFKWNEPWKVCKMSPRVKTIVVFENANSSLSSCGCARALLERHNHSVGTNIHNCHRKRAYARERQPVKNIIGSPGQLILEPERDYRI